MASGTNKQLRCIRHADLFCGVGYFLSVLYSRVAFKVFKAKDQAQQASIARHTGRIGLV